jgi:hypothetical protein
MFYAFSHVIMLLDNVCQHLVMQPFVMHPWAEGHTPTSPTATLRQHGDPECAQGCRPSKCRGSRPGPWTLSCFMWLSLGLTTCRPGQRQAAEEPLRHAKKAERPGEHSRCVDNTPPEDTLTMLRDAAVLLEDVAWLKDT